MLDPFPPPPEWLSHLSLPLSRLLSLPTLPLHIHEILLALFIYQGIYLFLSPLLSTFFFPRHYPQLPPKTRLNWDVHVVSLVQSLLINTLAIWVIINDHERKQMDWRGRVWGYTGAAGLVQGLAAGYFLWDLMVTATHVRLFGWGMLLHAVCALGVFGCGFRPFVNYYGPIFILYELSSPFLNIHWFFDKLKMTGSRAQLINGLLLLSTFFFCRLVWGTYQTMFVARDVWMALTHHSNTKVLGQTSDFRPFGGNESLVMSNETRSFLERTGNEEVMRFAGQETVPMWLAYLYLGANIALTGLNWWWFEKMISAVRKRFSPAKDGEKDIRTVVEGEKGDGEGEKMENGGLGDIGSGIENDLGKREREDSGGSGSGNGGVMKEEEGEEIIVRKGGRVLEVLSSSSIHGSSSSPVVEPTRSNSRPRRRHG